MLPPDIHCCIYFMNVLCEFMDLIYIPYRVGVNSIVLDQYNSVPEYSFLRDGE